MVVQYNCCYRDFVIDREFSMGLTSREFPGQSDTLNFCFLNIAFIFLDEKRGA